MSSQEPNMTEVRSAIAAMSAEECRAALLILLGSAQKSKPMRVALAFAVGIEAPEPQPTPQPETPAADVAQAKPENVAETPEPKPLTLPATTLTRPPAIPPETFDGLKANPAAYHDSVLGLELGARAFEALQDPMAEVAWCGGCHGVHTLHTCPGGTIGETDGVTVRAYRDRSGEPRLKVLSGPGDDGFFLDDPESFARLMDTLGRQAIADLVRLGIALISEPVGSDGAR